jgi:hypothetical protein
MTSKGTQLWWCPADRVHMTKDAYADLAHAIMEANQGGDAGDTASCRNLILILLY